jgi:hypothetical protein
MNTQRDVESFHDFLQYYQHHYVLSQKDENVMFKVAGAVDARQILMTPYRQGRTQGDGFYTEAQVYDAIQFGLPMIGMTAFNDQELMYLYYKPSRNGGRGFYVDRVVQHSFNGAKLSKHGLVRMRGRDLEQPEKVWNALKPTYVSLPKAWEDFQTGPDSLAYALNRSFGVYLSEKEHPTLCYRSHEIGDVLGPNKVKLFKGRAEYADPIRRGINADMEIEINEAR